MLWRKLMDAGIVLACCYLVWVAIVLSYLPATWRSGDGFAVIGIFAFLAFCIWVPFFKDYGWRGPLLLLVAGTVAFAGLAFHSVPEGDVILLRAFGFVIGFEALRFGGRVFSKVKALKPQPA